MKTKRRHVFVEDPDARDPRTGQQWCVCGLPSDNAVHELPDVSEQTAEHRRRVGEDEE